MAKNKKAISDVVATVIMIALVMITAGIVWAIVNNIVKGQTGSAKACFGIYDKVSINPKYTCYNSNTNELKFSINMKDVEVDSVLVAISGTTGGKAIEIKKDGSSFNYLKKSGEVSYGSTVYLPKKNSGTTYIVDANALGIGEADSIEIAPKISNNQCEVSDSLPTIEECLS